MDLNWVDASMCFPTFPRFCGQTFLEANDKDLALLCVQAYNDWMVEEWCAGSGGRLIPLCLIPLWDPQLAAAEVRRNAARGVRAVCFSELPRNLGLPSVHDDDRHWDPFVAACDETGTVICMHSGSGSKMPSTSADAPPAVSSTLTHELAEGSMADWLFSGLLVRYPRREAHVLRGPDRLDPLHPRPGPTACGSTTGAGATRATSCPSRRAPTTGAASTAASSTTPPASPPIDAIGPDQVTFETDYPHADGTWPHSKAVAEKLFAGIDDVIVAQDRPREHDRPLRPRSLSRRGPPGRTPDTPACGGRAWPIH